MGLLSIGFSLVFTGCEDHESGPVSIDPASPSAESVRHSLEAAEAYLASGDIDRARSILARLLDRASDDPRPMELMARLELTGGLDLRKQGLSDAARRQFAVAHDWYEQALELDQDSGGLHQSAGEVAQLAGRLDLARERYRQASKLLPDNPKPKLCIAQLILEENPAEAEIFLRESLQIEPDEPHALASLALARQRQGAGEEASTLASKALVHAGSSAAVRIAVARVHRIAGRPRESLELLLALPDQVRVGESATEEISRSWDAIGRPLNAGQAWAACFKANAFRTDAWRLALLAAEAMGRADQDIEAASWIEQAIMLDAPELEVEASRSRIAGASQ